jgi:prophage regulatory protein
MSNSIQREPSILRRKQVQARTGLARSTIYQHIQAGTFPRPVQLGPRAVGWLESEVSEWIAERVRIARSGAKASG